MSVYSFNKYLPYIFSETGVFEEEYSYKQNKLSSCFHRACILVRVCEKITLRMLSRV